MANEEMVKAAKKSEAREAFLAAGSPSLYEEAPVREALRELAGKLRAVGEATHGELEARLAWLDSLLPLREPGDLVRVLSHVAGVCQFVDNWTDCARPDARTDAMTKADQREREIRTAVEVIDRELEAVDARAREPVRAALVIQLDGALAKEEAEHDALFDGIIYPAQAAAQAALTALLGLVDAMRSRAPEGLQ